MREEEETSMDKNSESPGTPVNVSSTKSHAGGVVLVVLVDGSLVRSLGDSTDRDLRLATNNSFDGPTPATQVE